MQKSICLFSLLLKIGALKDKVALASKFPILLSHLPLLLSCVIVLYAKTLSRSLVMWFLYGAINTSNLLSVTRESFMLNKVLSVLIFLYVLGEQDKNIANVNKITK